MNTLNTLALKLYMKAQMILDREDGQDLVEYALLVGLVAVGAVAAMKSLSTDVGGLFNAIGTSLTSV